MRGLRKPINKEKLYKMYVVDKLSSVQISKITHVSPDTILRQLRAYGFATAIRTEGTVSIDKNTLYRLYVQEKRSLVDIANMFNCTNVCISKKLKKFGLQKYIRRGSPKGVKQPWHTGELSATKKPEVRIKMSQNHADVSGSNNPNYGKGLSGDKNGMYGKHHSEETIQKIKNNAVEHHIYLREHGTQTMSISRGDHANIHREAYRYLVEVLGKTEIDNYIKWYKKKYNLIIF